LAARNISFSNEGNQLVRICFAIQEIGGFDCEMAEFRLVINTSSTSESILYWIKVKLKASFGVLVPDYKESLTRCMGLLK
jgi:dTDP-4-dehydrorhamnose reductase